MDFTYGIEDLGALKWHGDQQVHSFLFCWRLIISKMRTQLSEDELAEILHGTMSSSTELKEDLAHDNRRPLGDPD
eukprot:10534614-Heterocapsa_arctica.AAC.1